MFGLFVEYCQYYISSKMLLLVKYQKAGIGTSIPFPFPPPRPLLPTKKQEWEETNLENDCKHV